MTAGGCCAAPPPAAPLQSTKRPIEVDVAKASCSSLGSRRWAALVSAMMRIVLFVVSLPLSSSLRPGALPQNPIRSREIHHSPMPHATVGVDESGRGAIAGPLFCAAVWLPPEWSMRKAGVRVADSKDLSRQQRADAVVALEQTGVLFSVAAIGPKRIDEMANVTHATHETMTRAVRKLKKKLAAAGVLEAGPCWSLVDGNAVPSGLRGEYIVKGDQKELCIAAASIVAKVHHDNAMRSVHHRLPKWSFGAHMGYGTKKHFELIAVHGASQEHRLTCSPFTRRAGKRAQYTKTKNLYDRIQLKTTGRKNRRARAAARN